MNLLKLEFEKLNCKLNSVLRSSNQISNLFECDARTEQKEKIFDFFERNKADGKIKDIFFFKSGKNNFCIVLGHDNTIYRVEFLNE